MQTDYGPTHYTHSLSSVCVCRDVVRVYNALPTVYMAK